MLTLLFIDFFQTNTRNSTKPTYAAKDNNQDAYCILPSFFTCNMVIRIWTYILKVGIINNNNYNDNNKNKNNNLSFITGFRDQQQQQQEQEQQKQYFIYHWPNFDQTLKVGVWDH